MKRGYGMSCSEIGDVFTKWNTGVLDSFLVEITRDILKYNDPDDGTPLVEKILDKAGQKGTGKWTAINALDLGMPVTLIGEAVFARCLSAIKEERKRAATILEGPEIPKFAGDREAAIADLEQVSQSVQSLRDSGIPVLGSCSRSPPCPPKQKQKKTKKKKKKEKNIRLIWHL